MPIYTADDEYEDYGAMAVGLSASEIAAQKLKQSAKPEGGRKEGTTTKVMENLVPAVVQGMADTFTYPRRYMDQYTPGQMVTEEAANWAAGLATDAVGPGIATAHMRPGAGMFGGMRGADNSPKIQSDFIEAFEMRKRGISDENIHANTGIHLGDDMQLRFEFSDADARVKLENFDREPFKQYADAYNSGNPPTKPPTLKFAKPEYNIQELFDHPELFKYYPELKEYKIKSIYDADVLGYFDRPNKTIGVRDDFLSEAEFKSTLLHEIQHYIQREEGFARGGSTKEFIPNTKDYDTVVHGSSKLSVKNWERLPVEIGPNLKRWAQEYNELLPNLSPEAAKAAKRSYYLKKYAQEEALDKYDLSGVNNTLKDYLQGKVKPNTFEAFLVNKIKTENPTYFEDFKLVEDSKRLLDAIEFKAYQNYKKLYGEFEARLTQERETYSTRMRRGEHPRQSLEFENTYPDGIVRGENIQF